MKKPTTFFTFDTETLGFEGDAVYSTVTDTTMRTEGFKGFDCVKHAFDHMHTTNGYVMVYIHNAAFDIQRLQRQLPNAIVRLQLAGASFISGVVYYRDCFFVIRDTMSLLPASLKKLSQSFCPELPKLTLDFSEEIFDYDNQDHVAYAKRDTETLMLIITRYAALIDTDVNALKFTAAGQAFAIFKTLYQDKYGKYYPLKKETNEKIAKYYYGGRIYIPNNHCIDTLYDTVSIDITSSYPHQMRSNVYPIPGIEPKRSTRIPTNAERYLLTIQIRGYNHACPILPYRDCEKVYYPHGDFVSHVTDKEYEYLKEHQKDSYDSVTVTECYYWTKNQCEKLFAPYIDKYYKLKEDGDTLNSNEPGSGDGLRTVAKLMLNSVYGKFAQKYLPETDEIIGFGVGHEKLSPFKPKWNDQDEKRCDTDHRNYHLSAFITGHARCQLYDAIRFYGAENVIYCDTDSAKIKKSVYLSLGKMSNENAELGGWKNEGEYTALRVLAPKVYCGLHNGKPESKSKGTPPRFITGIEIDGEKVKGKYKTDLYHALSTHTDSVRVYYGVVPNKIKTFLKSGRMGQKAVRTITEPEKVGGYDYNPVTRRYTIKTVHNLLG